MEMQEGELKAARRPAGDLAKEVDLEGVAGAVLFVGCLS